MIYEELQEDLQAAKVPLVESIVAIPCLRWKKNLQLVRQNSCFVRCTWPKEMHALLESTGGNVGKCGEMWGNAAMPKANRSLGNTQYGAISSWCNILIQNIICVLGFVSQYYVSRHEFIFSPTWAFKTRARSTCLVLWEVHALSIPESSGISWWKTIATKFFGCIGSTPPKGRYDFAHMPRLLSIWVKMLQHCFGSCKIHKRWGFLWWEAPIIKMWGPFMNLTFFAMGIWDFVGFQTWSTEVQGDMCQASTLSGPLVHLTLWGCRKLGLRKMTSSCSFMFILIPLSYACRHSIFMHLESRIRDDSVGFVCQSYVFPI